MKKPIKALYTAREDGDYDFLMAVDIEKARMVLDSDYDEDPNGNPAETLIQTVLYDMRQEGEPVVIIPFEDLSQITDVYCGEAEEA